jgi:hypothetical protein
MSKGDFEKIEFTQKDILEAMEEQQNPNEIFYTRDKLFIGLDFLKNENLEDSIERASSL